MCIANWISYAYIQIHSFPDSFSIYVIVEYWVEFSILYSVFPGGLVSKQSASNAGDVDYFSLPTRQASIFPHLTDKETDPRG